MGKVYIKSLTLDGWEVFIKKTSGLLDGWGMFSEGAEIQ